MERLPIGYGDCSRSRSVAHEKLLGRDHQEQVLKLDTFESNEKSKLSFRQWSDEFSSWAERIDQDFETMLRLAAQMQEGDKDKFIAEAQQDYRLGTDKVAEFDKHIYFALKRFTAGIAREIVDSRRSLVPNHRVVLWKECARRNRQCQSTPRIEATHPDCRIFPLAERDQEVGQRTGSTMSKRTDVPAPSSKRLI